MKELGGGRSSFTKDVAVFNEALDDVTTFWKKSTKDNAGLRQNAERLARLAEQSLDLVRQADLLYKLVSRLIDICENGLNAKVRELWAGREASNSLKSLDEARKDAVEQLK